MGLVRCDGTSPAKSGCDTNAASEFQIIFLPSDGGRETPVIGGSALSIYANGSGSEGAVSKGSAHANGSVEGTAKLAESECGVCDGSGVVAKVAKLLAAEGEKVEGGTLIPLLLPDPGLMVKGELSGCDVSDSPAGGCEETVSVLGSGFSLGRLMGKRRDSSPKRSGSNAGPDRKFATAADAAPYN